MSKLIESNHLNYSWCYSYAAVSENESTPSDESGEQELNSTAVWNEMLFLKSLE